MPDDKSKADAPGSDAPVASASLFVQAIGGRCPRCRAATLFDGVLRFAPRCAVCRLDFSGFNVGDGPAAFLTLVIGTLVTVAAIVVELTFAPSWWVHALLWPVLTIASVTVTTRWAKAVLLTLEYRHQAREGGIGGEG